jgi:alpha-mannosidase
MLSALAARVDTTVPPVPGPSAVPFLVWNPHPHPFRDAIELEAALDYRPLFAYQGRVSELPLEVRGPNGESLPFQRLETEHDSWSNVPWRARVLVPVDLAPRGWGVFTLGAVEEGRTPPEWEGAPTTADGAGVIDNGIYRIQASEGEGGISIWRYGILFCENRGFRR